VADPTKDAVTLTSGAAATVTSATPTDLRVHLTTPASSTGPLAATVTTYGGPSSPTLFAYFTAPSNNAVSSCMLNDARTAVNETTCVPALTGVPTPSGVALSDGYAHVASSGTGVVRSCTVSNGTFVGCADTTVTGAVGASVVAVAVAPGGGSLYALDKPNNAVTRCTLSSGALSGCSVVASAATTSAPLTSPVAIAVGPSYAYVADSLFTTGLVVCNVANMASCNRVNSTGIASPTGLAMYGTNSLLVTNAATSTWASCDVLNGPTLAAGSCSSGPTGAYTAATPQGLAAIPRLTHDGAMTLFVAQASGNDAVCTMGPSPGCTSMGFGSNAAVAVG
jgi:hypothetical protein